MQDYYDELWERLGDDLEPPDFALRSAFLAREITAGQRILDLGCGTGEFTAVIAQAGAHPIGIEVAQAAVARAQRKHPGLDFRLAPIDGPLPIQDNTFEVVWASEVIEHIADTAGGCPRPGASSCRAAAC
jgi:2-polyprenyl-3-methyl-5-hydroxy-6-metoxy-1,4-benzoquinol methylase